ncbi:MAG: hypothetical protein AB7P24_05935 [Nitrospira sp.]
MKGWAGLFGGFILGFLTAVIVDLVAPELLTPYTKEFIPATQLESIRGLVIKKERESNRLLMTLSTPKGVLLATFTQKIEEIDLLVAEGYATTIRLRSYSPFVENPVVERVEAATKTQDADLPPSVTE